MARNIGHLRASPKPRPGIRMPHTTPDKCLGHEWQFMGWYRKENLNTVMRYSCRYCAYQMEVLE